MVLVDFSSKLTSLAQCECNGDVLSSQPIECQKIWDGSHRSPWKKGATQAGLQRKNNFRDKPWVSEIAWMLDLPWRSYRSNYRRLFLKNHPFWHCSWWLGRKHCPKKIKKKTTTWNGINGTFRQEQNTGHETQEIKFSFPLDTYPETKAREAKGKRDRET